MNTILINSATSSPGATAVSPVGLYLRFVNLTEISEMDVGN
jgi:hypothetical protein